MSTKNIILGIVVLLGIAGVIGGYQYPKSQIVQVAGTSPSGSTFNVAKFAGIAVNLALPGANGTSTSILNTDSNDRYVTSFKVGCEGVGTSQTAYTGAGLSALLLKVGTTTTAAPATFTSFAAVALNFTVTTSTPVVLVSSSTLLTATSSLAAAWPTQTYMTFYWNATNTAACTEGVEYFGS